MPICRRLDIWLQKQKSHTYNSLVAVVSTYSPKLQLCTSHLHVHISVLLQEFLRRDVKPKTKDELVNGILQFWTTVTAAKCQWYISHLNKVIPEIIRVQGEAYWVLVRLPRIWISHKCAMVRIFVFMPSLMDFHHQCLCNGPPSKCDSTHITLFVNEQL